MYPIQDRSLYFIEFGIKIMLLSQFDIQLLTAYYDVIQFELFGRVQVFTILIGNATRMMRFKERQEGGEFHVEMRRVVVKRGREAGRQQGQWSRRGGPANRQTNISLWTQRSISPRRERYFLDPDLGIIFCSAHYGRGGRRH